MRGQFSSVHNVLLIESPDFKSPLHLTDGLYTVGRHPGNTIVISSPKLSRKHAYFFKKNSPIDSTVLYSVVDGDLNGNRSTNGLWVNGKQYLQKDLRNGDVICLTNDVVLKYFIIKHPLEILDLEKKFAESANAFVKLPVSSFGGIPQKPDNSRMIYA